MLKNYLLGLLFVFLHITSFAQGEASNWFFGNNVGLRFDPATGATSAIAGSALSTNEGSASISDSNGDLLFYTDGSVVWNKNNQVMPNGTGLLGDSTSTQSAIIVPKPNDANIYYVFTVDGYTDTDNNNPTATAGLNYSVIDMSLNGGLGGVVTGQKNINLLGTTSEKVTAVKSGNCSSFWVVTHFLDTFYSYEVSDLGVQATAVTTSIVPNVAIAGYRYNAIGYLKASPDGEKIAIAHHSNGANSSQQHAQPGELLIYDFNDITGQVSNGISLLSGPSPYGLEFSPNSKRLYASIENVQAGPNFVSSELFFFNLEAANIPASAVSMIGVDTSNTIAGALQLAPDGNIYRSMRQTSFLSVINNPDSLTPTYVPNAVSLNGTATFGLPPFIQSLFAQKVDIINNDNDPTLVTNTLSLCEGDVYTLAAEDITNAIYTWTLDGNPIANTTFDLAGVNTAGTYLVEVNPNNGDCPFLGEAIVTMLPQPIINTNISLESCFDPTDGLSDFTLSDANVEVLVGQLPTVSVISYHSNNADALSGSNPIATVYPSAGGIIYVRILNTDTGCVNSVPITLVVNPLPVIAPPVALEQCDTDSNGTVAFNLNEANVLLSANSVNETFVYFNSLTDAQSGNVNLAIQNPTNFQSGTGVSVYAAITSDKGCVNYGQVNLLVGTSAIPAATIYSFSECDNDYDGITTFDFSAAEAAIMLIFPPTVHISISYFENEADALAETNSIPDIGNHQNTNSPTTQRIWVRVDSQDLNGCLGLGEHIILTTNPLPAHNVLDEVLGCSDTNAATFDLSNTTSQALNGATDIIITYHATPIDAEQGINMLTSPYTSVSTTLFVRAENVTTGCYVTSMSVDLIVNPNPIIIDPQPMNECEDLVPDGFTEFNLTGSTNEIIDGATGLIVSYYTIEAEAIVGSGTSLIVDPVHFENTVNPQIIYIRVENIVTGCASFTELELNVLDTPQAFPFTNPLTYCDTDNDGVGYFDLSPIVANLTGGLPVDVVFYETVAEADAQQGAIDISVLYENINSDADGDNNPATQTIFAQLSILNLACSTLVPVNLVVIKSPELPSNDLVYKQCEELPDITDGVVFFDLTSFELSDLYTVIINSGGDPTEYTTSYYHSDVAGNIDYTNPINNPNAYENIETPDQLIYVVVEHTGSVSVPATGCSTIKAITLHIDLLPVAIYRPIEVCDDNDVNSLTPNNTSDGIIEFDLTDYIGDITGGATGVDVEFYTTEIAAEAGLGTATVPSTDFIDTPTAYENEFNPQAIFARVLNPSTGCYAVAIVALHVNPNPTPLSTSEIETTLGNGGIMEECDGNVDGSGDISEQIATFDLTLWETAILNGENGVSAIYYANADDAAAETNAIQNPATYNNISNPQTIYVSVVNDGFGINPVTAGTGCNTVVTFQLFVPVPTVEVTPSKDVICVDANGVPLTDTTLPVLTANALPLAPYDYQWMLNGVTIPGATNSVFTVTEPGDYTVTVSGPTYFDCINVSSTVTIEVSGVLDGFDANVTTNAFAESHQIVTVATSSIPGIEFWYSLDGGEPTTSGTFENVSPGAHIVTISDGKNCWTENVNVTLIDYPHFFTPNGDGINDTWKIIGQEGIPISQIYIFDRFGKLLSQLDPNSAGWDGTYNGSQMPASDYWFKIIYIEGADSSQKEFKAHFSLKR